MSGGESSGGLWQRLKSGLSRSATSLGGSLGGVLGGRRLDRAALAELEEVLIAADLGVAAAARIAERLGKTRLAEEATPEVVHEALAREVAAILKPTEQALDVTAAKPFVVLVVGVNGTGKTTTIGKLAHRLRAGGSSVVLAAGDTFRAAAIEQLKVWGARAGARVVAREPGADAAGLAYDAVAEARAEGADVVLVDTAGRLQNKEDLMEELDKVIRVLRKIEPAAPHAVVLVLDATTGQSARSQVEVFRARCGVTGLVMAKLDGTARGGMLVALAVEFGLPILFVGVGEGVEDLQPFDATSFSRALVGLEA